MTIIVISFFYALIQSFSEYLITKNNEKRSFLVYLAYDVTAPLHYVWSVTRNSQEVKIHWGLIPKVQPIIA